MSWRCGGITSYSGPCGAVDCSSCNPRSYRRAEMALREQDSVEQCDDGLTEHELFMKAFDKKPVEPKTVTEQIEDNELPF